MVSRIESREVSSPGIGVSVGRVLHENGLSLAMFALFFVALVGQAVTGRHEYNDEREQHGQPTVSMVEYLRSGHFVEAVFENWESEFLQMGAYVLLTVFLFQKGSAESKDPYGTDSVESDPRAGRRKGDAPWPVHRGGLALRLYENSLLIALFLLFLLSFALHAVGGAWDYSQQQLAHGAASVSVLEYLTTARFWFESFQNWQSEFLSIGVLVVLSIFLRQKGSPESKPVASAHDETGA